MSKQEPVQILSKSLNGTLKLDDQALKIVLKRSWDKPSAIVSICGEKRKGKSFLVNLLIHYLTGNLENNVLGKLFSKILDPTFEWRGGPLRNTEGIWITSNAITLETKKGPVALYVMDTQGMFDNSTTKQESDQIFTLSILMSSVLVYNLFHQLQSNDIEQLSYWIRIAQWVGNENSSSFLQNLVLLVRDFPHQELGYGVDGGKKYLNRFEQELSGSTGSMEVLNNWKDLQTLFPNLMAFTLPTPGSKIEKRDDTVKAIKMNDIDKKFRHNTNKLFKQLIKDLLPLLHDQNPMTGSSLYDHVLKCSDSILSKNMPHSKDLSDHVADRWLDDFVSDAVHEYRDKMYQILERFHGEFQEFKQIHEDEKRSFTDRFEKTSKFGKEAAIVEARSLMEARLDSQFENMSYHLRELSEARIRESEFIDRITKLEQYLPTADEHRPGEKKPVE